MGPHAAVAISFQAGQFVTVILEEHSSGEKDKKGRCNEPWDYPLRMLYFFGMGEEQSCCQGVSSQ